MGKTPVAAPHTEGRTFGTDWSIAHVATLLRANAARGVWRTNGTAGGYLSKINQDYLRKASARHLATGITLIFMRLEDEKSWYASLCFAAADDYLPWNGEIAEQWLGALFGPDRPEVTESPATPSGEAGNPSVRQFTLSR